MRTTPGSVTADSASGASMAAATVAAELLGLGAAGVENLNPVALARQAPRPAGGP